MSDSAGDPSIPLKSPRTPDEQAPASRFEVTWEQITSLGLADAALRLGTHLLSILFVLVIIWGTGRFFQPAPENAEAGLGVMAAEIPTQTSTSPPPALPPLPDMARSTENGITRQVILNTTLPSRARLAVSSYTVQVGDTLFGIADHFGLKPETILWSNYAVLADDPHRLRPGQVLNILPVDGTYYEWQAGDGLNGVARFFGVTPETIINFSANNLDPTMIGDYANPNIPAGTWLVVPGGRREFVTWSAPRITRSDPSVARVLGAGHCGAISDGPVGISVLLWPANNRFLSGYDYSPAANHFGIDIDGNHGDPVYASDNGVVVYAGWNDWGYGNMVVIDHGNGWQTLYAHLSAVSVGCGAHVYQGNMIGAFGSTGNSSGPHLHFELMHDQYGKVNPWDFLQ
jgi:murein DD-endopeptidase MepM/ murein hydrolase activator NlpD